MRRKPKHYREIFPVIFQLVESSLATAFVKRKKEIDLLSGDIPCDLLIGCNTLIGVANKGRHSPYHIQGDIPGNTLISLAKYRERFLVSIGVA